VVAAGALLALVASCSGRPGTTPSPAATSSAPAQTLSPAASPSATGSPRRTSTTAPRSAAVTKLLVVMVENHSLDQMSAGMPYTFGLAQRYGYATDYHAITHPSLPNYLAIASGQTYGVTDDDPPSAHPLPGATVFQQALDGGRTAGVFAEGMPTNCALDAQGRYAVKHNPWAYFVRERDACRAYDRPLGGLRSVIAAGKLPNAGMVIPDMCHIAHDCDLSVADGWIRGLMGEVFAGPDWRSGRLAVVVTADEDDHNQDNKVLTVVVHPTQHHHVVGSRLSHYSLTRLYEDVLHAPHLNQAAGAASMSEAFGLPLG
jgi:acid phosphatase